METYKITDIGEGFKMIQPYLHQKMERVIILTIEKREDGESKILSEKVEHRSPKPIVGEEIYIFTDRQYDKMIENYKLGNCEVTAKGLARYSNTYGCGLSWYGQPARTAKLMAGAGVKLPKCLFGLYSLILGEC